MSHPRLSFNTETAKSAVEQAEWNVKKWVWVPDTREGYVAGYVQSEDEDSAEVVLDSGRQLRRVRFEELFKMNPPKFDRVEDIADLTFLNEASVVHNLRLRYGSGAIYTYSGLFLVAINPYQSLPLYSDSIIQQYRGKRRDENPPHIFAVAERAWINMGEERENQSILITGESGAGKTESTKKVIQYLAAIAADVHLPPSTPKSSVTGSRNLGARGRLGLLERQILQANPILEAFGNAQTQRNNNSSRFGKFVRIMFSPDGSIAGASIDWYLLEKSRVVYRSESERGFHVFYQLLSGGGDDLKDELLLHGGLADFEFLNKSRREIDGVDDKAEWNVLHSALDTVGFDSDEQFDLFRIVATILHIGNISITASRSDDAIMSEPSQAERVCYLLGIPISEFTRAVLRPRALAGREWVTQARTRQQALDELYALCKTLYEKSFGALVQRINRALDRPASRSSFIGVLDIAGFEIFEVNGYEQLLINYTNEKLQQFFNHHMFVLEQEEYDRESIHWDYVNFGLDLQPTIDLIEAGGNTIGVLSCLDEECIMPKADDRTLTSKLNAIWASTTTDDENCHPGRAKYEPSRFEQGFTIHHYAAKVEYRTDGWLEKNKDPLNDDLTRVLAASTERYVAGLFADHSPTGQGFTGRKRAIKKGAFRTVAQRHKEQLASLMMQLKSTQPHFVRCIVPNTLKKPGRMDVPLVLDQLRCNGVLEGIRIARLGYPNRLPFVEFRQRYEILTPGILPQGYMDGREACRRMVHTLELEESIFKLGTSKIFFKAGVLAELEEKRDTLLFDIFSRLQAAARMWAARRQMRKVLHRAVAVRVIQRNARVYGELREWPWWQLYTKVRPLLAATRNDEELRKKELELALIRERAERDKQEREALEKLQFTLEAEKRKVEDDLEAERALTLDKDKLLGRGKQREADLEEEVIALQSDINTLDSQVSRAMRLQKESEEKYENMREAFDQAAEHLVRLQQTLELRDARELELAEQLEKATNESDDLVKERDKHVVRLQHALHLRDAKELELTEQIKKANAKLIEEHNKHLVQLEQALQRRDHRELDLNEQLKKATNEIDDLIEERDEHLVRLQQALQHRDARELELTGQLKKATKEIDDLIEERDEHLVRLQQALQHRDARELEFTEQLKKATNDSDDLIKEHDKHVVRLQQALQLRDARELELTEQLKKASAELIKEQTQRSELEKAKGTLESELLSSRSRLQEHEGQLAGTLQAKESLERQLLAALDECRAFETVASEYQQEGDARLHDLQSVRAQLETETAKRTQLEKTVVTQKAELLKLKEHDSQLGKDLTKAMKDLRARERDVRQLESKQDKTIVEHVHVLEEAKRVTDKELTRVKAELENRDASIRSLQTAKSKMQGEAEDLALKYGRELRSKEQDIKYYEKKVAETLVNVEKERRGREEAELNTHRVQTELRQARLQGEELSERLAASEHSRRTLEDEVEGLLDGPQVADLKNESSKSAGWEKEKDRLETKIADLERECEASTGAQTEQQSQIVSLQSQVRELRTVLDEAEVERTLLQKARRALRAELETVKSDHSEGRAPSDQEYQKLQLRNQDLEHLVEEQEDRIAFANEKAKTVESSANNSQIELGKVRVENSKLGKVNVKLEKQIKELKTRIKDLETRR